MINGGEDNRGLTIHTCCAICGSEIAERMREGYSPVIFFSNPNIYPESEYAARRDAARKLADDLGIPFFEDDHDRTEWLETAGRMPDAPEGGERCALCFELRLRRAANFSKENNIPEFTTTLAASPYKDEKRVGAIGEDISRDTGIMFVDPLLNENKAEAWKKALAKAKEAGYYRQRYCGCEFSLPSPKATDRRGAIKPE